MSSPSTRSRFSGPVATTTTDGSGSTGVTYTPEVASLRTWSISSTPVFSNMRFMATSMRGLTATAKGPPKPPDASRSTALVMSRKALPMADQSDCSTVSRPGTLRSPS